MLLPTPLHHHLGQRFNHPGQCPQQLCTNQQALARVFINEVEHEKSRCTYIMRGHTHEVLEHVS